VRVAPSGMLRILSFLSIEPGKQPLDQLNRRPRNRYVSVLPHADRGARYTHDLGKDRLGKLEPMPDGHQEGRFHVTLPFRATTAPWAGWPPFRWRRLSQGGLFICFAHVEIDPQKKRRNRILPLGARSEPITPSTYRPLSLPAKAGCRATLPRLITGPWLDFVKKI